MRILKIIGIGLLAIIALLLIVSFFLPSTVHVERSIVINAPAEIVFDEVNTLKKWEQWSPWDKMDPGMEKNYFGPESGTNAGYSWKGPKTGEGKMTVTDSKPNELIATRLDFGGIGAMSDYHFEPAEGGVKVKWTFDSDKTNNPMFRYMNVMMNSMLVNQFDSGLVAIKRIAESMPPPVKKPE